MLFYYQFWMITGFIIHFYITFGTNPLTGGPAHIVVLLHVSVFRRKGISNGVQTEWNLWQRDFWNECDPRNSECKPGEHQGSHEIGGRPPPSWPPRSFLDFNSKSPGWRSFQKSRSRRFHSVWTPYIFLLCRTLKQGKNINWHWALGQ